MQPFYNLSISCPRHRRGHDIEGHQCCATTGDLNALNERSLSAPRSLCCPRRTRETVANRRARRLLFLLVFDSNVAAPSPPPLHSRSYSRPPPSLLQLHESQRRAIPPIRWSSYRHVSQPRAWSPARRKLPAEHGCILVPPFTLHGRLPEHGTSPCEYWTPTLVVYVHLR